MATEDLTGTSKFIDDFVLTNPVSGTDTVASLAIHQRGIKNVLNNCFDSVTGKVTSTHTELNTLDGFTGDVGALNQLVAQGAFLANAWGDTGGAVDAMTITFTPAVTLTDGIVVAVKAFGQITATTPTFAPNGLTAKTIVKGNDEALVLTDIKGSDQTLLLQYDGTLDKWILLNPSSPTSLGANNIVMDDGVGVDFSAYTDSSVGGTATNQILIDYEEGSWTPTVQDSSLSDGEGQTYTAQVGRYTKIGNRVFFNGKVTINSLGTLTGGDAVSVAGLPYTANSTTDTNGGCNVFLGASLAISTSGLSGIVASGGTHITMYEWNGAAQPSTLTITELSSGGALSFEGQYIV